MAPPVVHRAMEVEHAVVGLLDPFKLVLVAVYVQQTPPCILQRRLRRWRVRDPQPVLAEARRRVAQRLGANRLLITELLPLLLTAANVQPTSIVAASLHDVSAKAWIWQKKGQFHQSFDLDEPAILVPNWLKDRADAIEFGIERMKSLSRSEQPHCRKAIWGVRLHGPIREIEVIGAWIDERTETIAPPPPDKRERSLDIHRYGYA